MFFIVSLDNSIQPEKHKTVGTRVFEVHAGFYVTIISVPAAECPTAVDAPPLSVVHNAESIMSQHSE